MIIGITGTICGGHDTVGKILISKGFVRYSLSDELREMMRAKGIEINRKNMQDFADDLRKKEGVGFLVRILASKMEIDEKRNYVIEAIRNPGEVNELRKLKDFILLFVDAPKEKRFQRLLARGRDNDEPRTFEEFIEWEKRDLGIDQPEYGQQQLKCFNMADYDIMNDGNLEALYEKTHEFLRRLNFD